jgi:hypothetical protein
MTGKSGKIMEVKFIKRKRLVKEYGDAVFVEKNKDKANELIAEIRKLDFYIQLERGRKQCFAN